MNDTKIFTVDKFLGLNESADGDTELKLGEASKIENFDITDNYNLKLRGGVRKIKDMGGKILQLKTGNIGGRPWMMYTHATDQSTFVSVDYISGAGIELGHVMALSNPSTMHPVKMFSMGGDIYVIARNRYKPAPEIVKMSIVDGVPELETVTLPYVPLMLSGTAPSGGGESMEKANLLTSRFRAQYSADGEATEYQLPKYTAAVLEVKADNAAVTGSFNAEKKTYTFDAAPKNGINNVEFVCEMEEEEDLLAAREKFFNMKHCEAYNGQTDTRTFFYGDGSNVCFYSGIGQNGPALYVPLGNEIKVDTSASPITAMARNYSSLIGFQPDGAFVITYEPVTLEDGSVTAGFYMRTASREFGNEMDNQVQTVNNYLRTVCGGSVYEWKYTSSQYRDERYAKRISEKVSRTLAKADASRIVTCDDNTTNTYYMFLNDDSGTVLVNRYDLEVWTVYKSEAFRNISHAAVYDGKVVFCNENVIFGFDAAANYDATGTEEKQMQISACWESGFMDFGAKYRQKYSSKLWLSILPESGSELEVTVRTDKRSEYLSKVAGYSFLDFSRMDFSNFSFLNYAAPKVRRIQIKVKKFVYYKLIFKVAKPGARATVLGYDQQVRYASKVK